MLKNVLVLSISIKVNLWMDVFIVVENQIKMGMAE